MNSSRRRRMGVHSLAVGVVLATLLACSRGDESEPPSANPSNAAITTTTTTRPPVTTTPSSTPSSPYIPILDRKPLTIPKNDQCGGTWVDVDTLAFDDADAAEFSLEPCSPEVMEFIVVRHAGVARSTTANMDAATCARLLRSAPTTGYERIQIRQDRLPTFCFLSVDEPRLMVIVKAVGVDKSGPEITAVRVEISTFTAPET